MHGAHDPILVLLSVLLACVAGYVALDLVGRVAAARTSPRVRAGWLAGGALAMGIGIWDMHFVGMLAFGLHTDAGAIPIAYDVPLVLLSVAVAVVASALALAAAGRERLAPLALAAAALLMGAAIAGMHYIGMAALRVAGRVSYVPSLVVASILVAVVASGVALRLAFALRADETGRGHRRRVAAAGLIGVAIAGMHYTAMAAARFEPLAGGSAVVGVPAGSVLATAGLAWSVGGATLAILVLALLGAALDRQLRARAERAEEFRRLYVAAEDARVETARAHELLQEQATELEQQIEEAQTLAEELEQTNDELRDAVASADRATAAAERAAARTARLQAVTAALSASLTPTEVAQVVIEHGLAALGARAGAVAAFDASAGELALLGAVGYPAHVIARFGRIPLDADVPLADAVRSGAPIILASVEERAARYPRLAALRETNGDGAMAAVPLVVEGRGIGALGINFPPRVALTADDEGILLALAQQCAQALERARLFEAEATSRREAQQAERRLAFLAEAGAALAAGTLDYEATLAVTAHTAVPALADYCTVDVLDAEGRLCRIAEAHADPAMAAVLHGTRRHYPAAAADASHPLRVALAGSAPRLVAEATEAWIASAARDPAHVADLRALGPRSIMMVPLRTRRRVPGALAAGTYGVLTLVATDTSGRRFGAADLALAVEFVRRAALAIDNARLFQDVQAARVAAERANAAKSDFLAVMSHELRTPINAVLGYADLMSLGIDGPVTEAQLGRLERIRASSAHLGALVNEILDFAKIESGELTVRREPADAATAVDAALAFILPQATARGLAIDAARVARGEARYVGDAQRVRQVLINLLSNAVKFTEPGGRIAVRCATAAGRPPAVPGGPALGPGTWTCVVVEDTGIGIAANQLDAVFEPFVQVDTGLTRAKGGTGLGLAISRQLARAMGGEVTAESTVDVGSRFTLWLPAAEGGAPPRS